MRDRVFYIICFGFLFGVLLRSLVLVDIYFAVLLVVIALALLLFFSFISKNQWGIIISIFVVAFSLGIFRFHLVDVPNPAIFESQMGQRISFSGEIVDEPNIKENNQQLIIRTVLKEVSPRTVLEQEVETKILLSVGLETDYRYGDEINFSGILKKPENFITDQGKEFDYVNYLRKDGILYIIGFPRIEIISRGNGNPIRGVLFSVKEKRRQSYSGLPNGKSHDNIGHI